MSIASIILFLVVIAFIGWLITQIPMSPQIKNIIIGVIIFLIVMYLIQALGFANFGLTLK